MILIRHRVKENFRKFECADPGEIEDVIELYKTTESPSKGSSIRTRYFNAFLFSSNHAYHVVCGWHDKHSLHYIFL